MAAKKVALLWLDPTRAFEDASRTASGLLSFFIGNEPDGDYLDTSCVVYTDLKKKLVRHDVRLDVLDCPRCQGRLARRSRQLPPESPFFYLCAPDLTQKWLRWSEHEIHGRPVPGRRSVHVDRRSRPPRGRGRLKARPGRRRPQNVMCA